MSQGVLKGTCLLVGGLCSCPVICLPSCVPELAPIDVEPGQDCIFLLISQTEDSSMAFASTSECTCGRKSSPEWLPPVSMSPGT